MKRGDVVKIIAGERVGDEVEVITTPIGKSDLLVVRRPDGRAYMVKRSEVAVVQPKGDDGER